MGIAADWYYECQNCLYNTLADDDGSGGHPRRCPECGGNDWRRTEIEEQIDAHKTEE